MIIKKSSLKNYFQVYNYHDRIVTMEILSKNEVRLEKYILGRGALCIEHAYYLLNKILIEHKDNQINLKKIKFFFQKNIQFIYRTVS